MSEQNRDQRDVPQRDAAQDNSAPVVAPVQDAPQPVSESPPPAAPGDSETILTLGADAAGVRVCLLEPVGGCYRLIIEGQLERGEAATLHEAVARVCQRMGAQIGRRLWDTSTQTPFVQSADPVREPPIGQVTAALSLSSPMRVWLAGLSSARSLAVARRAVLTAPSTIVGETVFTGQMDVEQLRNDLLAAQPQILVICGGYESATPTTQEALWHLCTLFASVLGHLPPQQQPICLYAGNRGAAEHAAHIIDGAGGENRFVVVDNVHPAPNVVNLSALSSALYQQYERSCRRTPEYTQLSRLLLSPARLVSLEVAFAQMVHAWMVYQKLPELHGVFRRLSGRMHVWASQQTQEVQIAFGPPGALSATVAHWPPVQLVCGAGVSTESAFVDARWRDEEGLAPIVASAGHIAPTAMIQVLEADLLQTRARAAVERSVPA